MTISSIPGRPRRTTGKSMEEQGSRQAWVMYLKAGNEEVYKSKHDEIWPEMLELMKTEGIRNYSIYRHGLTLFAYLERDRPATKHQKVSPIQLRWWAMMAPYMVCNPDGSPVQEPIKEMFHAD